MLLTLLHLENKDEATNTQLGELIQIYNQALSAEHPFSASELSTPDGQNRLDELLQKTDGQPKIEIEESFQRKKFKFSDIALVNGSQNIIVQSSKDVDISTQNITNYFDFNLLIKAIKEELSNWKQGAVSFFKKIANQLRVAIKYLDTTYTRRQLLLGGGLILSTLVLLLVLSNYADPFSGIDKDISSALRDDNFSALAEAEFQLGNILFHLEGDNERKKAAGAIFRLAAVKQAQNQLDSLEFEQLVKVAYFVNRKLNLPDWLKPEQLATAKIIRSSSQGNFKDADQGFLALGKSEQISELPGQMSPFFQTAKLAEDRKKIQAYPMVFPAINDDWAILHAITKVTNASGVVLVNENLLRLRYINHELENFLIKPSPELVLSLTEFKKSHQLIIDYLEDSEHHGLACTLMKEGKPMDAQTSLYGLSSLTDNPIIPQTLVFKAVLGVLTLDEIQLYTNYNELQKKQETSDYAYCQLLFKLGLVATGNESVNVNTVADYFKEYFASSGKTIYERQSRLLKPLVDLLVNNKVVWDPAYNNLFSQFSDKQLEGIFRDTTQEVSSLKTTPQDRNLSGGDLEEMYKFYTANHRQDLGLLVNLAQFQNGLPEATVYGFLQNIIKGLEANSYMTLAIFPRLFPSVVNSYRDVLSHREWEDIADYFLDQKEMFIELKSTLSLGNFYAFIAGFGKLVEIKYGNTQRLKQFLVESGIQVSGRFADLEGLLLQLLPNFFNACMDPSQLDDFVDLLSNYIDVLNIILTDESLDAEQHLFHAMIKEITALRNFFYNDDIKEGIRFTYDAFQHLDPDNRVDSLSYGYTSLRALTGLQAWVFLKADGEEQKAKWYKEQGLQALASLIDELAEEGGGENDNFSFDEMTLMIDVLTDLLMKRHYSKEIDDYDLSRELLETLRKNTWKPLEAMSTKAFVAEGVKMLIADYIVGLALSQNLIEEDDNLIDFLAQYSTSVLNAAKKHYEIDENSNMEVFLNFLGGLQQTLPELVLHDRKYITEEEQITYFGTLITPVCQGLSEVFLTRFPVSIEQLKKDFTLSNKIEEKVDAFLTWQLKELAVQVNTNPDVSNIFSEDLSFLYRNLSATIDEQLSLIDYDSSAITEVLLVEKIMISFFGEFDFDKESVEYAKRLKKLNQGSASIAYHMLESLLLLMDEDYANFKKVLAEIRQFSPQTSVAFQLPYAMALCGTNELTEAREELDAFIRLSEEKRGNFNWYKDEMINSVYSPSLKLVMSVTLDMNSDCYYMDKGTQIGFTLGKTGSGFDKGSDWKDYHFDYNYNSNTLLNAHLLRTFIAALQDHANTGEIAIELMTFMLGNNDLLEESNVHALSWLITYLDLKGYSEQAQGLSRVVTEMYNYSGENLGTLLLTELYYEDVPSIFRTINNIDALTPLMKNMVPLAWQLDFFKPSLAEIDFEKNTDELFSQQEFKEYLLQLSLRRMDRIPTSGMNNYVNKVFAANKSELSSQSYYKLMMDSGNSKHQRQLASTVGTLMKNEDYTKALQLFTKYRDYDLLIKTVGQLPSQKWSVYVIRLLEELILKTKQEETSEKMLRLVKLIEDKIDRNDLVNKWGTLIAMMNKVYLDHQEYERLAGLNEFAANKGSNNDFRSNSAALHLAASHIETKSFFAKRKIDELRQSAKIINMVTSDGVVQKFLDDFISASYDQSSPEILNQLEHDFLNQYINSNYIDVLIQKIWWMSSHHDKAFGWAVLQDLLKDIEGLPFEEQYISSLSNMVSVISTDNLKRIEILERFGKKIQADEASFENNSEVIEELLFSYYNEESKEKYDELLAQYLEQLQVQDKANVFLIKGLQHNLNKSTSQVDSILYYLSEAYLKEINENVRRASPQSTVRRNVLNVIRVRSWKKETGGKAIEVVEQLLSKELDDELKKEIQKCLSGLYSFINEPASYRKHLDALYREASRKQDETTQLWVSDLIFSNLEKTIPENSRLLDSLDKYERLAFARGSWELWTKVKIKQTRILFRSNQLVAVEENLRNIERILFNKLDDETEYQDYYLDATLLILEFRIAQRDETAILKAIDTFFEYYKKLGDEYQANYRAVQFFSLLERCKQLFRSSYFQRITIRVEERTEEIFYDAFPFPAIEMLYRLSQLKKDLKSTEKLELAQKLAGIHNSSQLVYLTGLLMDAYIAEGNVSRAKWIVVAGRQRYDGMNDVLKGEFKALGKTINDRTLRLIAEEGDGFFQRDAFPEAIEQYLRATSLDSTNVYILSQLAYAYYNSGEVYKAQEYLGKALSISPPEYYLYINAAKIAALENDYDQAYTYISNIRKAKLFKPYAEQYKTDLVFIYQNAYDKGVYARAIQLLDEIYALDNSLVEVFLRKGECEFFQSNYSNAITHYKKYIETEPDEAYAYHKLGLAYWNLSKYTAAQQYFEKAINLAESFPQAHMGMAAVYNSQGKYLRALEQLMMAYQSTEEPNVDYFMKEGSRYADASNKLDEQLAIYSKLVENFPQEVTFRMNYAYYLAETGNTAEAEVLLLKIKKDHSNDSWLLTTLGRVQMVLEKYPEAIDNLKASIKVAPDNEFTFFLLGQVYQEQQQYRLAIENYTAAVAINENYGSAWSRKADCEFESEAYFQAVESVKKLIELDSDNEDLWHSLGLTYHKLGKLTEEKAAFQEAMQMTKPRDGSASESARNLGNYAWHCLFAGDFTKALMATEEAIKIDPESFFVYTNQIHAMLFTDQLEKAVEVYKNNAQNSVNGKKFYEVMLQDFDLFEDTFLEDNDTFQRNKKKFLRQIEELN